jgi:hypothetical protein
MQNIATAIQSGDMQPPYLLTALLGCYGDTIPFISSVCIHLHIP